MRPKGNSEQLATRRQYALDLLASGKRPSEVAEIVGVSTRSLRTWKSAAAKPPRKRKEVRLGRPQQLKNKQVVRLRRALLRGAYTYGFPSDHWTLDRITRVIWDLFEIRYTLSGTWSLLKRIGWSCQRVKRVSNQRDDEAVAHWLRYEWPQIKKVA